MFLLFLLALLASASTLEVEVSTECSTCILANTTCYNVSHILDLQAPFRNKIVIHKMGIQRSENRLYYSFEPAIEDAEYFKVGFVNLDNHNESGVISSQNLIINFGTFDIDQDNGLVYLGGSDGVFVLDTKENKLSPFSSRGDTIESIFYKNNVYFVLRDDLGIIVKRGDNFQTLLEYIPVKNFVVNKYDVIVFLNRFGLHVARVGKGETVYRLSRNAFFRGITMDLDGTIFAWWIDGIYKVVIDKILHYSKLVKHVDIASIGAMTFDNENNILFTVDKGLYRMTPSESGCGIIPT
ncbi:Uncharacterized protein OBRU01_19226 [Operophtera brumata]|uniref:Ommochrome-binding protein n=1 Tax=Operophtera brumata TaxID=104452 RepID=A0A0L7KVE0_OPEBR|nr:Uncharacterized protein OBRU01_19226 [Operophtera brumata]